MILRDRNRIVDPCYDEVVSVVFRWPFIFILCFIYFDQNGRSSLMQCPKWPRKTFSFFFREAWNAYFIFRELQKDHFIFCEMWSRLPFTTLFQGLALEMSAFQIFQGSNSSLTKSFDKIKCLCFTQAPTDAELQFL